jgi:hypothetical protein
MVKTSGATVQDLIVRASRCRGYVDPCFSLLLVHLTLTRKFIISDTFRVTVCFHTLNVFLYNGEVKSTGR